MTWLIKPLQWPENLGARSWDLKWEGGGGRGQSSAKGSLALVDPGQRRLERGGVPLFHTPSLTTTTFLFMLTEVPHAPYWAECSGALPGVDGSGAPQALSPRQHSPSRHVSSFPLAKPTGHFSPGSS